MDISYVAGFFDGEGCIILAKPCGSSRGYSLRVSITQKHKETLVEIQKMFNGKIYPHSRKKGEGYWSWEAVRKEVAYNFLKTILPYLQLKRKQAQVGLMFLEFNHNWHREERELCWKVLKILKE